MGIRFDITFIVNKLCEANTKPITSSLAIMKYLFRYLIKNVDVGIVLGGKLSLVNMDMKVFGDASYVDDPMTRYSIGGYIVFIIRGLVY